MNKHSNLHWLTRCSLYKGCTAQDIVLGTSHYTTQKFLNTAHRTFAVKINMKTAIDEFICAYTFRYND